MTLYTAKSSAIFAKQGKSLAPLITTLPKTNNDDLKKFLEGRLERGNVHAGIGAVATIDLGIEPAQCYYSIVACNEGDDSLDEYVICLVTECNRGLDKFRQQLDNFINKIEVIMRRAEDKEVMLRQIKPLLECWYDDCLMFIVECVKMMGKDTKYIIYNALCNGQINVDSDDRKFESYVEKFHSSCTLSSLLNVSPDPSRSNQHSSNQSVSSDTSGSLIDVAPEPKLKSGQAVDILHITCKQGQIMYSSTGYTSFCEEWSQTLLERYTYASYMQEDLNPLTLKQVNDRFKIRTIQDMNTLKRLVIQAEIDFYALYRCYDFLDKTGNSSVLLFLTGNEEQTTESSTLLEILQNKLKQNEKSR